jgi:tetratricopeptide (TPR) repeat protein
MESGTKRQALAELTRSVFLSPSIDQHWYLTEQSVRKLPADDRAAIKKGLTQAVDLHLDGSVSSLGDFLHAEGNPRATAALFARAAAAEPDPTRRLGQLLASGEAYAQSSDLKSAEAEFRAAISTAPRDPRAYTDLITLIFAGRRDSEYARALVVQGVQNGAEPATLYDALAQAEKTGGDWQAAAAAWHQALAHDPTYWQAAYSLGLMYLQRQEFEIAINALQQAAQIQTGNSEIYYNLAVAEDQSYKYFDAERDYARAAALAPQNAQFRDAYAAFKRKVAESGDGTG